MVTRIYLFHWNGDEIESLAAPLRRAGYQVETEAEDGGRGGKAIAANPPAAVVFYLTRLPSHSFHTAEYLHERKSTRGIPLVFVGDDTQKAAAYRAKLPAAHFIAPDALLDTLAELTNPA
ncbi:MAG: hypothetical protein HYZ26_11885 [Chloroflexi bacterium]|nr:hypothetical protein [Chloroflexota bacterium]